MNGCVLTMRIRRIDRRLEQDILTGMIMSKGFMARIRRVLDLDFFKNPWCRIVASWCVAYYDEYSDVPQSNIQNIFDYHDKKGDLKDVEDIDLIRSLLEGAAENYDGVNVDFLVDKTEEYFNRVRLELMVSEIEANLDAGNVEAAKNSVLDYKTVRVGDSQATDGLTDEAELQAAFDEQQAPLFNLPGAVGEMVNSELCRDKFIALQAPEKTGKTYWLLWLALRALRARLKVVMFELEMTKNQVNRRMSVSISGISDRRKYCDNKHIPKRFSEDGEAVKSLPADMKVEYEDGEPYEPLDWRKALECNTRFYERFHLKKDRNWRLITAPARSINIRQIDAELERLQKEEEFVPDVVLIDYMDILAAENPREQERERINSNWVAAKALCNKWHVFLASVTQSDSPAYNTDLQTRSNFSEDHRKYAHTNGTLGLTQTPDDKRAGIAKLNWLVLREGDFNERDVCYVLQCLKKGRFCIDSTTVVDYIKKRNGNRGGRMDADDEGNGASGRSGGRRSSRHD